LNQKLKILLFVIFGLSSFLLIIFLSNPLSVDSTSDINFIGGIHYLYWDFSEDRFTSFSIEITIHSEPSNNDGLYFQMYQSKINDVAFYFGLQTEIYKLGEGSMGKGLIFSRWETRDLANTRIVEDVGWTESSGHEGDFIGVRRTYKWTTHSYRFDLVLNETDVEGQWYSVSISDLDTNQTDFLGSLRFPFATINGIHDGGITWTELYWKNPSNTTVPTWKVSIDDSYITEAQIRPDIGRSIYAPNYTKSDIYMDEFGSIFFTMGSSVTRIQPSQDFTFTQWQNNEIIQQQFYLEKRIFYRKSRSN
jgi:hypothetical protein